VQEKKKGKSKSVTFRKHGAPSPRGAVKRKRGRGSGGLKQEVKQKSDGRRVRRIGKRRKGTAKEK